METTTLISLIIVILIIVGILIYRLIAHLKEYFQIGQERDVHSSLEIFRPLFQDREARYEESRRFEWVHLSQYNMSRSQELPPIYP